MRHPAYLLLAGTAVLSMVAVALNIAYYQQEAGASEKAGVRARLRARARRHPQVVKVQVACVALAGLMLIGYWAALLAGS